MARTVIHTPKPRTVDAIETVLRDHATGKHLVDSKVGPLRTSDRAVVQVATIDSAAAVGQYGNTYTIKFNEFAFDITTAPNRQTPTLKASQRTTKKAIALGGQAYEQGEIVLVCFRLNLWFVLRRLEGDIVTGTTTSVIPAGGSGTADIIAADGTTVSRTVHDRYNEEIGNGVIVFGWYAPDGRCYVFSAECEAAAGVGPVNPTP